MKKRNNVIILLLIIINQLTILKRNSEIGFTSLITVFFIFGILCDVVLVYIIIKQDEKKKIAKELEEVRFQAERERIFYEELDKQSMEMAKIRHDYNNLITSVLGLIHMGREKEAEEMIEELMRRMEQAEGKR